MHIEQLQTNYTANIAIYGKQHKFYLMVMSKSQINIHLR